MFAIINMGLKVWFFWRRIKSLLKRTCKVIFTYKINKFMFSYFFCMMFSCFLNLQNKGTHFPFVSRFFFFLIVPFIFYFTDENNSFQFSFKKLKKSKPNKSQELKAQKNMVTKSENPEPVQRPVVSIFSTNLQFCLCASIIFTSV